MQRGIASAAAAAAIYFEERRMQVSCLWYLLQSQILPEGVLEEDAQAEWDNVQIQANQYTKKLLRDEPDGKRKLFNHLLQLIQVAHSLSVFTTQAVSDLYAAQWPHALKLAAANLLCCEKTDGANQHPQPLPKDSYLFCTPSVEYIAI